MGYLDSTGLTHFWDKIKSRLSAKQNKLTGNAGQLIGIDDGGAAAATVYPSNPNLLDNWYFADPINQRGETEYTNPGYTIDRWFLAYAGEGSKIILSNSYLSFVSGSINAAFRHRFENLPTGTYTLSVLCEDGLFTGVVNWDGNTSVWAFQSNGFAVLLEINNNLPCFTMRINTPSTEKHIIAAKLELGSVQTLAHKEGDEWVLNDPPPNKALELAKCQRYYFKTALSQRVRAAMVFPTVGLHFFLPTPVTMRTAPAIIGDMIISGVTGGIQTGFSFSIANMTSNGFTIVALKESLGMSDAVLQLNGAAFSADL